jgi:hypothetical protein
MTSEYKNKLAGFFVKNVGSNLGFRKIITDPDLKILKNFRI